MERMCLISKFQKFFSDSTLSRYHSPHRLFLRGFPSVGLACLFLIGTTRILFNHIGLLDFVLQMENTYYGPQVNFCLEVYIRNLEFDFVKAFIVFLLTKAMKPSPKIHCAPDFMYSTYKFRLNPLFFRSPNFDNKVPDLSRSDLLYHL